MVHHKRLCLPWLVLLGAGLTACQSAPAPAPPSDSAPVAAPQTASAADLRPRAVIALEGHGQVLVEEALSPDDLFMADAELMAKCFKDADRCALDATALKAPAAPATGQIHLFTDDKTLCQPTVGPLELFKTEGCNDIIDIGYRLSGCEASVAPVAFEAKAAPEELVWTPASKAEMVLPRTAKGFDGDRAAMGAWWTQNPPPADPKDPALPFMGRSIELRANAPGSEEVVMHLAAWRQLTQQCEYKESTFTHVRLQTPGKSLPVGPQNEDNDLLLAGVVSQGESVVWVVGDLFGQLTTAYKRSGDTLTKELGVVHRDDNDECEQWYHPASWEHPCGP